jgi:hypothetical protein
MNNNKSAGDIAAETYEALTRAEQEHRALVDAHTQHTWAPTWDAYKENACVVSMREAWARVQRAAEVHAEATRGAGWAL